MRNLNHRSFENPVQDCHLGTVGNAGIAAGFEASLMPVIWGP
jgi:hypothetical protein